MAAPDSTDLIMHRPPEAGPRRVRMEAWWMIRVSLRSLNPSPPRRPGGESERTGYLTRLAFSWRPVLRCSPREPPPAGDRTAWQLLRSPRLTVLHTRYPRSLRTPAHNHGAWAVVSVYRGREDNVRYVRDGANIREVARQSLHPGDAVVLESTEIHDLATSSDRETCSIHVYGVDLYCPDGHSMWVPPSLEERSYDEKEFVRHTTAMTREARGVTAGR